MRSMIMMLMLITLAGCTASHAAPVIDVANPHKVPATNGKKVHVKTNVLVASTATGWRPNKTSPKTAKAAKHQPSPTVLAAAQTMADEYDHADRLGAENIALWSEEEARLADMPPRLLMAMAATESSWNPRARSSHGAYGLVGVKPSTWGIKTKELLSPHRALHHGAQIFAQYRDKCKPGPHQLSCAVQMYNVGETAYRNGTRAPGYLAAVRRNLALMGARI